MKNFLLDDEPVYRVSPRKSNETEISRLNARMERLERILDAALQAWQSM